MEILNQFGVQPLLLLAQVVNFLILLFILKKLLYKPILKVLKERQKKIEESLKNAEEIENRLVQITDQEQEAALKSAREGEKIIKEAGEYAAQIVNDGKVKAQEIINAALEQSRTTIQVERTKLEQEIKENVSEIVAMALGKVTGQVITKKMQKEIIDKEVKNLT